MSSRKIELTARLCAGMRIWSKWEITFGIFMDVPQGYFIFGFAIVQIESVVGKLRTGHDTTAVLFFRSGFIASLPLFCDRSMLVPRVIISGPL
jgi:hypothetical protein